MKAGMIKVSVMYPSGDGKKFNMDYYLQKHVPMVVGLLGDSVKGAAIEKGLGSAAPGSTAPFEICAHLYFETMGDYQNSFGPNAEKIMGDIPNFTNIEPVVQVSEVVV